MDFDSIYDTARVAEFICLKGFRRVALQFPDELLKHSTKIVAALQKRIRALGELNRDTKEVKLYVMADTTYGNCCVDEVGAAHANADCVIHYGHTCLSPTSTLPAFFVFGKASINVPSCVEKLFGHALKNEKPVLVLYGLEYAHAIPEIKEVAIKESSRLNSPSSKLEFCYADVINSVTSPSEDFRYVNGKEEAGDCATGNESHSKEMDATYAIGGLSWSLTKGHKMEDYLLFYIGSENSAFANVLLTFNSCELVRYDATKDWLVNDFSSQNRILKRRYFLVEKAKDASIVGILVGTLGVAGYLHMIHQMKELITKAGKKAYTFVMGRPNPAKLANFPEASDFTCLIYQIVMRMLNPFLHFCSVMFSFMFLAHKQLYWIVKTFMTEFRDLLCSTPVEVNEQSEEARFSFLHGGYVEDFDQKEVDEVEDGVSALVSITEKALQVRDNETRSVMTGITKSGADFFAARSFHGLDIHCESNISEPFLIGRSGKASGYTDDLTRQ
nr:diphthamide biosynthesis protein 2 [Ipomoea batatas]